VPVTAPAPTAASMGEVLRAWADRTPDTLAFGWLIDGEEEGPAFTYADLDREARAVAVALREAAEPGDRALLVFAPGLEFVAAFFGCQYAGLVPVPVYPPRLDRPALGWQGISAVAADCRPRVVLTGGIAAGFVAGSTGVVPGLGEARCVVTDDLDRARGRGWREPAADPDGLAILQYTSDCPTAGSGRSG
jgi:acyl-CoA synthetase (AMP-forming)/AMP-acid ligase II